MKMIGNWLYRIGSVLGVAIAATAPAFVVAQISPPVANIDYVNVNQDIRSKGILVLQNDVAGGGTLQITRLTAPDRGGSATLVGGGSIVRYIPVPGFSGIERFKYTISNGAGLSTGVVRVRVRPMPPPPPPVVTIQQIYVAIFDGTGCNGCHTGVGTRLPGALNLSSPEASFASLVGVPSRQVPTRDLIEPGSADISYLFNKLEGSGIVGSRMPFMAPPLDTEQIDLVRRWIDGGALP